MANSVLKEEKNGAAVAYRAERVNLYEFGYERSGSVKGDPDMYEAYLERIINGDLVEESYNGFTDDEKQERLRQIKEL